MRVADCLQMMSKLYLNRIVDSFITKDFPRHDEERLREQISQNTEDLSNHRRIAEKLQLASLTRPNRILFEEILVSLLENPKSASREDELYQDVKKREEDVIARARKPDAFALSDGRSIDVYETVLEAALEDEDVDPREFALLERLRMKLKINRLEHRLLEARLGKFPRAGNAVHGIEDFKNALKTLQTAGILFYCNQADDGPLVVLPEEIALGVMRALGFEMRASQQRLLHDKLTHEQLYRALQEQNLPVSGSKDERSERLVTAGCKPSEVLAVLQNTELGDLCRKLHGLKVSGSKEERRDRIIDHFASLPPREPADGSNDPRASAYQYLEELAKMESSLLRSLELIKHDREMAPLFEEGTRYLFEWKLGCNLIEQDGSDHSDGATAFADGELLLWDNKAKEEIYTFPKSHADQFRRYIEDYYRRGKRVKTFLIVVPEIGDEAEMRAIMLKNETVSDTDIALIAARDLKFVAENWHKHARDKPFNPILFNATGLLTRSRLERWMQSFL